LDGHETSQFEEEDGGRIVVTGHYAANLRAANSLNNVWAVPPERLELPDDRVHLWRLSLLRSPSELKELRALLVHDELTRAARFHFNRDRDNFIAARGTLRRILGEYLDLDPSRVCLSYSSYGKPALAGAHRSCPLRFNLAHSHQLALFAFTNIREIGVDVEHVRSEAADERVAANYFSPNEAETLRSLPSADRVQAFYNCWTRKEAFIKARGDGLSFPLAQFDVDMDSGEHQVSLKVADSASESARWSLQSLVPAEGYVGAIAVEGSDWQLDRWQR
jgi:4'-phosphopantetheinyl transferase